ncbi:MAG: hypothetical protein ABGX27_07900, partial [Desulfurobacteriaceae bacterium]
MDRLNIITLALIFRLFVKLSLNIGIVHNVLIYLPLWFFDFFNVSKNLSPLSNLELIISLFVLFKIL